MLSTASYAADAFFTDLEELPIMSGLVENQAAAVTFETANGRIIEVEASGTVSAEEVVEFYSETLPQLGWEKVGDIAFQRDQERLTLRITDVGAGRVLVAFSLSPKS
jgi:hypothetical protein